MPNSQTESPETNWTKLAWMVVGLLGTATLAGVTSLIVMYANQQATGVRLANIESSLIELKSAVADGTRNRYTGDMASDDRLSVQQQINSMRDAWATSFGKLLDTNTAQDGRLAALETNVARLFERLGKTP